MSMIKTLYIRNIIFHYEPQLKTEPQQMTLKGTLPYTVCSGSSSKLDGSSKLTTDIGKNGDSRAPFCPNNSSNRSV